MIEPCSVRPAGRVLLSGANGFVGRHLCRQLIGRGDIVRCLIRQRTGLASKTPQCAPCDILIGDLLVPGSLTVACEGINTVFHCAGYAHAFCSATIESHRQVNYQGTCNLVEAAGRAGVRHFVFLSTVKAMAEPGEACVDEDWPGEPATPYGQAKRAAEEAVLDAGAKFGMHVVNLRLAMVYGPGGRGNLERMARLVRRGIFPPLPETGNRRSLVHVEDVVDVMQVVAQDFRATGRTYIIAEPRHYSGREIYEILCRSCGKTPYPWSVPSGLFRAIACAGDLAGKLTRLPFPFNTEVLDRLLGSACYLPNRIERELGWRTSRSFDERAGDTFALS